MNITEEANWREKLGLNALCVLSSRGFSAVWVNARHLELVLQLLRWKNQREGYRYSPSRRGKVKTTRRGKSRRWKTNKSSCSGGVRGMVWNERAKKTSRGVSVTDECRETGLVSSEGPNPVWLIRAPFEKGLIPNSVSEASYKCSLALLRSVRCEVTAAVAWWENKGYCNTCLNSLFIAKFDIISPYVSVANVSCFEIYNISK